MCAATTETHTVNGISRRDDGPITDADVAAVLRPFVRATRPLLGALSDSDAFGLQARAMRAADNAVPRVDRKLRERLVDRLASTHAPLAQLPVDARRGVVRRTHRPGLQAERVGVAQRAQQRAGRAHERTQHRGDD